MSDESGAKSAETVRQQVNVFAPTCLDIWLNEPRNAPESRAPANLLRLWFPESIIAHDSNDNVLWEHTFETRNATWRYVNESIGDMKSGRAIRKVLESVDTVDGLALIACSARWRETDIDLTLRITNVGPLTWSRLETSICLQRPAAPDYLDEEDTRTYLVSDEGFVASAELAFPPRRRMVYAWVGEELPVRKGARRRLVDPAFSWYQKTSAMCSGMPGSRRGGSFSTGPDASNAFIPTRSSAFSSLSTSSSDRVSYS